MTPRYHDLLDTLRRAFPQPVSDPVHDAYFVYSISRALDQVDALKGQTPILGQPGSIDWAAATTARLQPHGQSLEAVIPQLVHFLEGMFIWGHPRTQVNVTPPPSIASVIGTLLPATYNPNLCSEEAGFRVAEAEVRVAAMSAQLVGYDPAASAGVFTFGGTGAMLYGLRIGLEKAVPGSLRRGLREDVAVLVSDRAHYCTVTAAGWLGIGEDQVLPVRTHLDNSIDLDALLSEAHALAARIARNPGQTLRLTKRLLREGQHQRLDSLLELSAALQVIAHKTPAHAEAVNAFIEKREPKFGDV